MLAFPRCAMLRRAPLATKRGQAMLAIIIQNESRAIRAPLTPRAPDAIVQLDEHVRVTFAKERDAARAELYLAAAATPDART